MPTADDVEDSLTPASPESTTVLGTSRRLLPLGALAAGLTSGAILGTGSAADAATSASTSGDIGNLSALDRLVLNRFSYGISSDLAGQVQALGSAKAWFHRQLNPTGLADPDGDDIDTWYPRLQRTPQQLWAQAGSSTSDTGSTTVADDLSRYSLMRRAYSTHQIFEVMVEFWSNLLHVPAPNDKCWPQRPAYDATIRAHALGKFDELLPAAVLHPAMLLYLDNYASTKDAPNENLGRELLECHTVGRETPYTETDVLNSTQILTGWAVDRSDTWQPSYYFGGHYQGPVQVMGFSDRNAQADGRATTLSYLDYLAHHPATATRIAERLITRFVGDVPPPRMVADVAAAFTSSGTDIPTTLLAIVNHPQFAKASQPKVRTPTEDLVATLRALGVQTQKARDDDDLGAYCVWISSSVGQRPFDWPTPDGFPDAGEAWASTSRMLGSWTMHQRFACATCSGAQYVPLSTWLPPLPATLGAVIHHISRTMLFDNPSTVVVNAASAAVGQKPTDRITKKSLLVRSRLQILVTALLDSTLHMTR